MLNSVEYEKSFITSRPGFITYSEHRQQCETCSGLILNLTLIASSGVQNIIVHTMTQPRLHPWHLFISQNSQILSISNDLQRPYIL